MSSLRLKQKITASPSPSSSTARAVAPQAQSSRLAQFADDAAGEVMVMFGLMAITMFMLIGLAIDYGRYVSARDQTLAAMDAAVLAAGRALQTKSTPAEATAIAQKYYAAAVANRIKTKSDTVKFEVVDDGKAVQAKGNATIATPFMGFEWKGVGWKGVKTLSLVKDTASDQAKAVIAEGIYSELNREVAVMLDVSGSMCNNNNSPCSSGRKLTAMKDAAKNLVSILVPADQSKRYSKVAIVPFSADVRPPASLLPTLVAGAVNASNVAITLPFVVNSSNGDASKGTYYFAATKCAAERSGTNRYTDLFPNAANGFISRIYANVSNSSTTSGSCSISTAATVVPLTNNIDTLNTAINALVAQGGTAGHVGTAWAYYMLSPKWSSLLTGISKPGAYEIPPLVPDPAHPPTLKKIAILMTDGEYNQTFEALKNKDIKAKSKDADPVVYSPLAAVSTTSFAASGDSTKSLNAQTSAYQAIQVCTEMKKNGIVVYTVGFELPNQTAVNTLAACATDAGHAYTADNAEELVGVFKEIAIKEVKLHLTQ